jgi:cell division protein ZapA
MSLISVSINGRVFKIHCEDGEEQRLRDVASYLDRKLKSLQSATRNANDLDLITIATLQIVDEYEELSRYSQTLVEKHEALKAECANLKQQLSQLQLAKKANAFKSIPIGSHNPAHSSAHTSANSDKTTHEKQAQSKIQQMLDLLEVEST